MEGTTFNVIMMPGPHPTKQSHHHHHYQLYSQRWLVLVAFSTLSINSAWIWITWSPMADEVSRFWGVTEGEVDALSAVYMFIYVLGSFPSIWLVVNVIGLARGLWVASILNVIGALIRFIGMNHYKSVYWGTLFCALAQTFTLATPPLIAGNWFGAYERATATALGVLANQFGTALGLGSTIIFDLIVVPSEENGKEKSFLNLSRVHSYLGTQLLFACIALCMVFIFVTADGPLTPPSSAAASKIVSIEEEREMIIQSANKSSAHPRKVTSLSYLESVHVTVNQTPCFVLLYGIAVGVFYTIPAFLSQLVPSWSPGSRGWLGVSYQLAGVMGSFISGRVVDVYQHHQQVSTILLAGSVALLAAFTWALIFEGGLPTWTFVASSGVGFCLAAFNTVGFELGTAMTYPADEAAVAGILECAAELAGFVLVTLGGQLKTMDYNFILFQLLAVFSSLSLMMVMKAKSTRPTD